MGDITFLFNGQANGVAATAANTGVTTLFATSGGGTATYSTAMAGEGSCGIALTNGTVAFIRTTADTLSKLGAYSVEYTTPATLPTTGNTIWAINVHPNGNTTTRLINVRIGPNGEVDVLDQTNSSSSANTVPTYGRLKINGSTTTLFTVATSTRYRFELQWSVGTDAVTGFWALQIYATSGDTSTPLTNTTHGSATQAATNLGTVEPSTIDVGINNSGVVFTVGVDIVVQRAGSSSPVGRYSVPTIYLTAAGSVVAGTWTKTGTGDVLSDADAASGYTSVNNPTNAALRAVAVPIAKPAAGVDLICPIGCRADAATTASIVMKLYVPGGYTTLLATSQTQSTIPSSNGVVNVTFLAANIAAITDAQFAGGLGVELLGTAA